MTDAVVRTRYGSVRGAVLPGAVRYLGVPYAAPPVGARRWQAPQTPLNWSGIRDATTPGANAPQIIRAFPGLDVTPLVGHGWQPGEDFLTANIWTPPEAAGGRPVLVFIHGGAFIGGSSNAVVHAGTSFARAGIVYVAINYRLGIEGFLPIPGVPTNLGLRDQIAALAWVRDNIAQFGGDPANVTVAGESAGAMSIANLLASPLADGLIKRAIVQSGHGSMFRPDAIAQRVVHAAAAHLQVPATSAGFAQRSAAQCAAAVYAVSRPEVRMDLRDDSGWDAAFGLSRFLPVYGDEVLPLHPLEALAKGAGSDVDLLIGTTHEEMNIYLVPTGVRAGVNAAAAGAMLAASSPCAAELLRDYGLESAKRPGDALCTAMTDLVFRLPARRFAAAHRGRTHLYEFAWRSPACGGELGACHGLELPFVFNTLATCRGPSGLVGENPPEEMAQRIHAIWVDAVSRGHFAWPEYTEDTQLCLMLDSGAVVRDEPMPAAALA